MKPPRVDFELLSKIDTKSLDEMALVATKLADTRDYLGLEAYLKREVGKGRKEAILLLGNLYEIDPDNNEKYDLDLAFKNHVKSAQLFGSIESLLAVARYYRYGFVQDKNESVAIEIYEDFISNDLLFDGFVYWLLGVTLIEQDGFHNTDEALAIFKKGWALNHVPCLSAMGSVMYLRKNYFGWLFVKAYSALLIPYHSLFDRSGARLRVI